jgi:hypothetical protein
MFAATSPLPAVAHATFYYLQGTGSIHTRAGLAPGNPVITLRTVGPLVIGRTALPLVRVHPAAG